MFLGPGLWTGATASAAVVAHDAAVPANICTAIGANKAIAVKYFGKGAYPKNVTQYDPPTCDIDGPKSGQLVSPSGRSTAGMVWVVLTPKTANMSTMAEYLKDDVGYPGHPVVGTPLASLGAGAIFHPSGNDPYIYFAAGQYFVEEFDAISGSTYPLSTYIPKAELLGFARYIYTRLS